MFDHIFDYRLLSALPTKSLYSIASSRIVGNFLIDCSNHGRSCEGETSTCGANQPSTSPRIASCWYHGPVLFLRQCNRHSHKIRRILAVGRFHLFRGHQTCTRPYSLLIPRFLRICSLSSMERIWMSCRAPILTRTTLHTFEPWSTPSIY
jgi:hypothetical protein